VAKRARRVGGRWVILGLTVAVVAALVVAAVQFVDPPRQEEKTIVWGSGATFPENFFPVIGPGVSVATGQLGVQVLPGPFRLRPDLTVVHDDELLTSAPTSGLSGDRQVVTYRLNPGAAWSDGQPITAEDFAFSWRTQRSADPADGGCPALVSTTGYDQIVSVDGRDAGRTVEVTFRPPFSDWKSLFNQQLFPAHVMDRGNAAANCRVMQRGWPAEEGIPVSGGPWRIDAAGVDPGLQTVILTPNPQYWGRRPKVDRLIWQAFSTDASAVVGALQSGEIDLADPPPQLDLLPQLRRLEPAVHTEVRSGLVFDHLDFNVTNPHLRQKAVRQAIVTALDRQALVRATVGQIHPGTQVLNNRMYVNSQPEYEATNGGRYEHAEVAAARRLLEAAGYTAGPDGVYARRGQRLSLQLITPPKDRMFANAADVIAAQLDAAGVEVDVVRSHHIFGDKDDPNSLESGRFDMALFYWLSAPFVTAGRSVYESPRAGQVGQNYSRGFDPRVDELFADLAHETDPVRAASVANRIDRLLWDDLYTVPLYQRPVILARSRSLTNAGVNATISGPGWNASDWDTAT
jgi:ABC-type transport system substrate-binding protein